MCSKNGAAEIGLEVKELNDWNRPLYLMIADFVKSKKLLSGVHPGRVKLISSNGNRSLLEKFHWQQ